METTQAEQLQPPALGLVKSEAPDTPSPSPAATVQTQVTVSAVSSAGTTTTVTRPPGNGSGLFAGIAPSSNKRPRTDDWLAPESPQGPLPQQHIYLSPQQQQQQSVQQQHQQQQQQQPPMAHSTPVTQQQQQQSVIGSQPPSNNGYASPMSSGSYDPYSPNGKIGRDDLSPPSSLNGYSADSCDAKKKKGPTPRQQEELCLVCGDRASGYHYNALTCEGCKGFFRRSITKNAVYQCKYGNNCEIDMYMRRKCQECRLKKCLHVGMRPECVVPEFQCAVKRKEKKAQKEKDKPNSTTMNGSPGDIVEQPSVKTEPAETESYSMSGSSGSAGVVVPHNGFNYVSTEQEELINRLVYFQDEYEQPNEEDVSRITDTSIADEDPSEQRFRQITEITILTVQLIVEFAKRLPGFDKLRHEDKIVLLKACSSEVMILRMARKYDYQTDSIIFANNQPYSRDSYTLAGIGNIIDDLLHFGRLMYSLKVNNAEYALLTAIVIFSERPNVVDNWKVEKIQEIYMDALKAYVESRRKPKGSAMFAKLLSVLTELRTLGNQNSETCSNLKLRNKKLPAFLEEIWDVNSLGS